MQISGRVGDRRRPTGGEGRARGQLEHPVRRPRPADVEDGMGGSLVIDDAPVVDVLGAADGLAYAETDRVVAAVVSGARALDEGGRRAYRHHDDGRLQRSGIA